MLAEIRRSQFAGLLAAIADKQHAAFERRPARQRMRQLQHRRGARRIVVRAVVDAIAVPCGTHAQMVEVRRQQNRPRLRIGSRQITDRVVREARSALRHRMRTVSETVSPSFTLSSFAIAAGVRAASVTP